MIVDASSNPKTKIIQKIQKLEIQKFTNSENSNSIFRKVAQLLITQKLWLNIVRDVRLSLVKKFGLQNYDIPMYHLDGKDDDISELFILFYLILYYLSNNIRTLNYFLNIILECYFKMWEIVSKLKRAYRIYYEVSIIQSNYPWNIFDEYMMLNQEIYNDSQDLSNM